MFVRKESAGNCRTAFSNWKIGFRAFDEDFVSKPNKTSRQCSVTNMLLTKSNI